MEGRGGTKNPDIKSVCVERVSGNQATQTRRAIVSDTSQRVREEKLTSKTDNEVQSDEPGTDVSFRDTEKREEARPTYIKPSM